MIHKFLMISSIIFLICAPKLYSQTILETQIGKLVKNEDIVNYFKDQEIIVFLSNENCNEQICDPAKISHIKDIKIYEREEVFLRALKTIAILEIKKIDFETTEFKVKMSSGSFLNVLIKIE